MNRPVSIAVLGLLLALTACTGSTSEDEGKVERAVVPDNACELVTSDLIADWGLAEVSHSTSTETTLSYGRCSLAGGSGGDEVTLNLSLTNYSGGDADSAAGFAADERTDTCTELSAAGSSSGTVSEGDASCTSSTTDDQTASTILISEVPESFGVVRVEMRAAVTDADRIETAVEDLVAAVRAEAAS